MQQIHWCWGGAAWIRRQKSPSIMSFLTIQLQTPCILMLLEYAASNKLDLLLIPGGDRKCVKLYWEFKEESLYTVGQEGSIMALAAGWRGGGGDVREGKKEMRIGIQPEWEALQRDGSLIRWNWLSPAPPLWDLSAEEAASASLSLHWFEAWGTQPCGKESAFTAQPVISD